VKAQKHLSFIKSLQRGTTTNRITDIEIPRKMGSIN
jgi:hypothetical protein